MCEPTSESFVTGSAAHFSDGCPHNGSSYGDPSKGKYLLLKMFRSLSQKINKSEQTKPHINSSAATGALFDTTFYAIAYISHLQSADYAKYSHLQGPTFYARTEVNPSSYPCGLVSYRAIDNFSQKTIQICELVN